MIIFFSNHLSFMLYFKLLQDLLALLKTVETEIAICESNLHDEVEKRKKYKVSVLNNVLTTVKIMQSFCRLRYILKCFIFIFPVL